jgi:Leucine-rich repeat (LRR) protein
MRKSFRSFIASFQPFLFSFSSTANSGLVGSIPNEIRWLERMETLNLEFNGGLIGTLPPGLWKMQSLTQLVLQWCNLEGTIPPWIGEMTNLEYLGLGNNQFTGVVPTEIGNLVRLELLGLDDNVLDGDIEILSPLSNLKSLYLENNYLVGTLSEVLMMSWPNLEELDISGCLLTGELPPNFFNHQNNLRVIDLHANGIKGPLPDGINENSKLEFLALHENVLSGMIPESLTSFKLLRHLDLSRNSFTATLPERLGEMTNLEYLFVGNNNYTTWEIPKFLIELTYLRELSMKDSHLTGTIPEFIGYLSNLEFLDFRKCDNVRQSLSCCHDLPLSNMFVLCMFRPATDHNALMDEIPSNLGQLTKLRHLILKMNMLRGTIPTTFAGLSDLDLLLLEQNDFQGDIEVICSSDIMTVDTFVADCGKGGNISCSCCSQCCDPGDALCNDWEWKGNLDPIWEYGYRRRRYSYNLGPVTWVP